MADTTADWDGEFEKLTGAFGFNYTTTKDAKVTEASKKTCVKTDSSVKYHYSYVERQELDPITETKTVTTPDDDDGDGGDKIIEEKDHDSPVLPGTPELPPCRTQSRTPLFCLLTPLCPLCRTHMPCRRPA